MVPMISRRSGIKDQIPTAWVPENSLYSEVRGSYAETASLCHPRRAKIAPDEQRALKESRSQRFNEKIRSDVAASDNGDFELIVIHRCSRARNAHRCRLKTRNEDMPIACPSVRMEVERLLHFQIAYAP